MKKVIERGNTTMCQMFGGFFNKNFGKFINTNLEILLSTEPFTLEKIPCFEILLLLDPLSLITLFLHQKQAKKQAQKCVKFLSKHCKHVII